MQNDIKLIKFLSDIKNSHNNLKDNFLVKIHPARNFNDFAWIKTLFDIDLLPHNMLYENFINIVDILLAHTSGIAAEVLFYGKKVGIIDILDDSPGNGSELNKYLRVPLLKHASEFNLLYENSVYSNSSILFYKTGAEAKKEIKNNIRNMLIL